MPEQPVRVRQQLPAAEVGSEDDGAGLLRLGHRAFPFLRLRKSNDALQRIGVKLRQMAELSRQPSQIATARAQDSVMFLGRLFRKRDGEVLQGEPSMRPIEKVEEITDARTDTQCRRARQRCEKAEEGAEADEL